MADTIQLTGTLEDYKSKVEELNQALDQLDNSSQEYANTLTKLQQLNAEWAQSLGTTQQKTEELKNTTTEVSEKVETNFKTVGTAILGVVPGLNTLYASWKTFQTAMMTNPWIAILTVALTGIIALFNSFKKAIQGNEETSMKWKKSMATLQPIINLIKNAIDKLATAFVNMISWVMDRVPSTVKFIGNYAKTVLNIIANIVDSFTWLPRQIATMWSKVIPLMTEGAKKLLTPFKTILNALGLDDWAAKIDTSISKIGNTMTNVASGITNGMQAAGNAIRGLGNGIQTTLNGVATSMQHTRNLQEEQNKLTKEGNELLIDEAKKLSEINDLRNEAKKIQETDPLKAQELINKANEKTTELTKRKVEYEERTLKLMQQQAALAPNSAKDNRALAEQEAKVWKTRTEGARTLNRLIRDQQRIENELEKARKSNDKEEQKRLKKQAGENKKQLEDARKLRQKEILEAAKAEAAAAKEQRDLSKQIYNDKLENIKIYEDDYNEFKKYEETKINLKKQLNILEKKDRVDFENQRYKEEMSMYEKTINDYIKLIEDANVLESEKHKARLSLDTTLSEQRTAEIQHQINIAKIDAEELAKYAKKLEDNLKQNQNKLKNEEANVYSGEISNLNKQYEQGEIAASEYLKKLEKLRLEHEESLKNIEILGANERIENTKKVFNEYLNNIQERYKDITKYVEIAQSELNNVYETGDDEQITKAEEKYNLLTEIAKSGVESISEIINNILSTSENQSEETNILFKALGIDENAPDRANEILQKISEVFSINLDELLNLYNNYQTARVEANRIANEQETKDNENHARDTIDNTKKQINQIQKVSNQLSKTMKAVGDYWQQSIEQRLEAGEISKEQAEEEFERLKQFNIAQAVVDTISGALSAYMSVWKSPSLDLWAKIAMSVLMGAQTLASGYAQIRQIQSQTLSGASAGSSGTNVIVGAATPILSEAQDINNLNAMSAATEQDQTSTRVYVLESDITEAQNKTRVRVQEASF